jgi:hypothetical protein
MAAALVPGAPHFFTLHLRTQVGTSQSSTLAISPPFCKSSCVDSNLPYTLNPKP